VALRSSEETTTENITGYRGRIAPSPTGLLHVGHARTFWTAFARARAAGGTLILRNEDLDPERSKTEYAAAMIEDLRWLGIRWDEGPDVGGPVGPYAQSQRRGFYLEMWMKLLAGGWIYPCRCSRKELARIAQAPHDDAAGVRMEGDEGPMYPGTCRVDRAAAARLGERYAEPVGVNWRFRVPEGEAVTFEDGHFGPQRFLAGEDFGDFAVWRRDDVPAYQLAVVADDHAMEITEVARGADLLLSAARQILLYRAMGWAEPRWFHCDLVTDARGERLAKRHDALAIRTLREQGWRPEAVRSGAVR
jgi:glutamyl/glutaminyl-tRNA synthetase